MVQAPPAFQPHFATKDIMKNKPKQCWPLHAYPSTWEPEARGSVLPDQLGLHSKSLSQPKRNKTKNKQKWTFESSTLHTVKQGIPDSQRLDDGRDAEGDADSTIPCLFKYIPSHIILMNNSPVGARGLRLKTTGEIHLY